MSPVELMLCGAVGSLTTAVVYMFTVVLNGFKEVKAALKDCEDDREQLWERLAGIGVQPKGDKP